MARRPTKGMFTQNFTKPVGLPSAALPPTIAEEEEVFPATDSFVTSQNKPAPETKNTAPAPAAAPAVTQYYITNAEEAKTKGGDVTNPILSNAGITQVDEAGLKSYYDSMAPIQNTFGSYENFKNYSTEYAQVVDGVLAENNAWFDIPEADSNYFQAEANLDQETLGLTDAQLGALAANQAVSSLYGAVDLSNIAYTAPDGTTQTVDATEGYQLFTDEANQGNSMYLYNLVHGSDAYKALTSKYNIPTSSEGREFIGEDGDLWKAHWNGSGYVTQKIRKIDSGFGLGDLIKVAAGMFLGVGAGAAFAAAGVTSGALSSALGSALNQAVMTGEIDPKKMLESAAISGLSGAISEVVSPYLQDLDPGLAEALSTGNEAMDNVLSTMAMDAVKQGIIEGKIDLEQTITSGLFATASEFINWFEGQMATSAANEEQIAEWNRVKAEEVQGLNAEILADTFGDSINEAIAQQQSSSMSSALQNLAENLQSVYEEAYAVDTSGVTGPSLEDFMANSVDDTDSELADTTADLQADTTANVRRDDGIDNPFEGDQLINGVYYNESGFPVGVSPDATPEQILAQFVNDKNAYTVTSGQTVHGLPPEAVAILVKASLAEGGEGLTAFSTFLTDNGLVLAQGESGDYILIAGTNSQTGIHNSVDLDSLVNLQTPTNENFLPNPDTPNELLNPTDRSDVSDEVKDILTSIQEAPDTPLDLEVEIDPLEFEIEPELTPEPPPEPEPVEPVEPTDQDQAPGDAGTASPSPDPTVQPDPSFTPAATSAPQPAPQPAPAPAPSSASTPAQTPQEEAPITTGLFGEYFPPAPAPAAAPAPAPAASPAAASAPPPASSPATTPTAGTPTDVGSGSGAGVPTGQPSITAGDVETIVERALENIPEGMTPEQIGRVVNEAIENINFPEGISPSEINGIVEQAINNIQFPESLTSEDVEGIVQGAGFATGEAVTQVEEGLREALAAQAVGTARQLTEAEARLLQQITGVEANTLRQLSTVEGALNTQLNQLGTNINDVRSELESSISGIALSQEQATEERRNLQQAVLNAQGNIEQLDANTRQQFEEFGGTVNQLFSDVNVDIDALQAGQISQAEAQQAFQQSTEEQFGEIGGQIGDLGTQIGGLASDVSGLGAGLEGLGQGVAGLGAGLGMGLLGLGQQQEQIVAELTKPEPIPFDPFLKGLSPFQILTPTALSPVQQRDAVSDLDKFIRQSGMLV